MTVYIILYQLIFLCVFEACTIKNAQEAGIEVQVWSYPGTRVRLKSYQGHNGLKYAWTLYN